MMTEFGSSGCLNDWEWHPPEPDSVAQDEESTVLRKDGANLLSFTEYKDSEHHYLLYR